MTPEEKAEIVKLVIDEFEKLKRLEEQSQTRRKRQERAIKKKRMYQNTKLLLENYRWFKAHCENAVTSVPKALEIRTIKTELSALDREIDIKAIKSSVSRTFIVLTHIDEMLLIYRSIAETSNDELRKRRFKNLCARYINDSNLETSDLINKLQQEDGTEERTVFRDIEEATNFMGILIFGFDKISHLLIV